MGEDLDATMGFQGGLIETLWAGIMFRISTRSCDDIGKECGEYAKEYRYHDFFI